MDRLRLGVCSRWSSTHPDLLGYLQCHQPGFDMVHCIWQQLLPLHLTYLLVRIFILLDTLPRAQIYRPILQGALQTDRY